jgi:hypothetical protein
MMQTSTIVYFHKIFDYLHSREIEFHEKQLSLIDHRQKRLISNNTKEEKRGEKAAGQLVTNLPSRPTNGHSGHRDTLKRKEENYDNQNLPGVCRQMQ